MRQKRFSNIGYYLKEGISGIFTHGFMSFASVVIIVACLLIMGSFLLVAMNINVMIAEVEGRNQMTAHIDEFLPESDARALEWRLLADENVYAVHFITREDALDNFLEVMPGAVDGIEQPELIFRHRFVIDLHDIGEMQATESRLMQISGIESINADTRMADWFVSFRNILTVVFVAIIGVLLIISIFIIANTVKLATFDRREEIAIMRMVGATKGFIRWPFVFQGFLLGLFGAALAFVLQWALYAAVANQVVGALTVGDLFQVFPFNDVAELMIAIFLGTGFLVGTLGSVVTIRSYLRV